MSAVPIQQQHRLAGLKAASHDAAAQNLRALLRRNTGLAGVHAEGGPPGLRSPSNRPAKTSSAQCRHPPGPSAVYSICLRFQSDGRHGRHRGSAPGVCSSGMHHYIETFRQLRRRRSSVSGLRASASTPNAHLRERLMPALAACGQGRPQWHPAAQTKPPFFSAAWVPAPGRRPGRRSGRP